MEPPRERVHTLLQVCVVAALWKAVSGTSAQASARSYLTHDVALSSTLWEAFSPKTSSLTRFDGVVITLRDAPLRPRFSEEQALLELQFMGDTIHGLRLALEGAQKRLRLQSTDPANRSSSVDVSRVPREVILHFSTRGSEDGKPTEEHIAPTEVHVFLDCERQDQLSLSLPLVEMAGRATGLRVYRDKRLRVDTIHNVRLQDVIRTASTSCGRREAARPPEISGERTHSNVNLHWGSDSSTNRLAERALIDLIELLQESKKAAEVQTRALLMLTDVLSRCQFCRAREGDVHINVGVAAVSCADRPCFAGVSCRDEVTGYKCGPCPPGYAGDGVTCRKTDYCARRPCFPGVECRNMPGGFRCGPCPTGFQV